MSSVSLTVSRSTHMCVTPPSDSPRALPASSVAKQQRRQPRPQFAIDQLGRRTTVCSASATCASAASSASFRPNRLANSSAVPGRFPPRAGWCSRPACSRPGRGRRRKDGPMLRSRSGVATIPAFRAPPAARGRRRTGRSDGRATDTPAADRAGCGSSRSSGDRKWKRTRRPSPCRLRVSITAGWPSRNVASTVASFAGAIFVQAENDSRCKSPSCGSLKGAKIGCLPSQVASRSGRSVATAARRSIVPDGQAGRGQRLRCARRSRSRRRRPAGRRRA